MTGVQTCALPIFNRSTTTRWSIDLGFSAPVDPGAPTATARSARYVFDALARQGRFPLRVAGPAGPEPFAVWAARHDRNEGVTP